MNPVQLIAPHLKKYVCGVGLEIKTGLSARCAITGAPITEGVQLSKALSSTFTDFEYLKYKSDYLSLDAYLCISEILPSNTPNRRNSLRAYSYYASLSKFQILKREDILPCVLALSETPFILCVSYNNKKHTSYKAKVNWDTEEFIIRTDLSHVVCRMQDIRAVLPILNSWYRKLPNSKSENAPTFFTKQEILTGRLNFKNVEAYGEEQAYEENAFLENFRKSAWFELLVHILNKTG